jgi:glycosyltransferase involved in cell wall biosynthesis
LIQIGGLVAEKDPLGMLSLFSKIKNQDLHLVFLGSGPLEGALQESITKLNLEKRVRLIPNQANIFPYLDRAKALVMPSKVEGLPGVILEAMYCRVPVIAYGVGGIPEVLQHGKTGWCIPPANQEAFVEAMEQVMSLNDLARKELLENAFQLVKDNYTLDRVALEFEKFYERILE